MDRIKSILIIVLSIMLFSVWQANAGNPTGPGTPPASTSSYTLEDIYNRLNAGTAGSESNFTEPAGGPSTGTMYTLNDIMGKAPIVDDTNGASAASVESGKTFWGLTSGEWALQTGTATLGGGAGVAKTGQTICYEVDGSIISCPGTGEDGQHQAGVTWPNPRFSDNSDGTVTDNLTGLIWLKNANCFNAGSWASALINSRNLSSGTCGLSDGSTSGDWRLPNVRELQSLIHYGVVDPAIPNTAGTGRWAEGDPFTSVQSASPYWTSTTMTAPTNNAWVVLVDAGGQEGGHKINNSYYFWPVRDAE